MPISMRITSAGIAAMTNFTSNTTMLQNGIRISVTITA
jgi:hypothetical protein